jgi:hypothetical protein
MCVIAHKSWNVGMPSVKTMKDMFEHNPDGAGLMWQETIGGPIHFKKGLMEWGDFLAFIKDLGGSRLEFMRPWNVVLHFRIGTHGSRKEPILTQPFPIAGTWDELSSTEGLVEAAVAHNGIFRGRFLQKAVNQWAAPQHDPMTQGSRIGPEFGWSDTMEWVEKILYPLYTLDTMNTASPMFNNLVDNIIDGSRVIILGKHGTRKYGAWESYEDCAVSNLNFRSMGREELWSNKWRSKWWSMPADGQNGTKLDKKSSKKKVTKDPVLPPVLVPLKERDAGEVIDSTLGQLYSEEGHRL